MRKSKFQTLFTTLIIALVIPFAAASHPIFNYIQVVCHKGDQTTQTLAQDERFSNRISFQSFRGDFSTRINRVSCDKVCLHVRPLNNSERIRPGEMSRTMSVVRLRASNSPDEREMPLRWSRASSYGAPDTSIMVGHRGAEFCWDQKWHDNNSLVWGWERTNPLRYIKTIFDFKDRRGWLHRIVVTPRN